MSNTYLVMYTVQQDKEQQKPLEYPNAFVLQAKKQINPRIIREVFPWDRLPEKCPRKMRFGLKSGHQTFWLDLQDEESIPLYSQDAIFIKLSE